MAMVCLCHGVSERRVRREIERGAGTVEQVGQACRAGTCCGGCRPTIESLLAEPQRVRHQVQHGALAPAT
jgi:bacterioferritin-associated ferredoxin